ncbi:hypothetical protein ACIBTV_27125 [Micromonospora sp. NPDC049366]|uniref:hypothetical protein n=1 Tax=Micromonospora sp. NPDC049366 TaxID=3364271 RepID=UPI0037888BC9
MTSPQHPGYLALLAAAEGPLRAVVEHHRPHPVMSGWDADRVGYWQCHGCDPDRGFEDYPDGPCSTIQLIAEQLGEPMTEDGIQPNPPATAHP